VLVRTQLRPTLMAAVPLILDRLKAAVEEKVAASSGVVR
jgi:long-subunit acyl-CoA synthetase (AMP-forming)